jgi:3-deoxy-D-manno-octulosonate 8-phosphate phosphatase KdsC-like HAD superfamily phosphatase
VNSGLNKLGDIGLVAFDVDGVFTDGRRFTRRMATVFAN